MEIALVILVVALLAVTALWIRQILVTRERQASAHKECEALKKQIAQRESEAQKSAEAKRQAVEELKSAKGEIKELKKKRHEERDAAKFKRELEQAKEKLEREMLAKLAQAQEVAAESQGEARRLSNEMKVLQEKLADAQKSAAVASVKQEESAAPAAPAISAEDKAKIERLGKVEASLDLTKKSLIQAQDELQIAKRDLERTRRERDQLADQLKKTKGRADVDRRLFLVQKGELEVAKDKFRTMEARHNALLLEKDDLARSLWMLEKELKTLRPMGESAAVKGEAKAEAKADAAMEPKAINKDDAEHKDAPKNAVDGSADAKPAEDSAQAKDAEASSETGATAEVASEAATAGEG